MSADRLTICPVCNAERNMILRNTENELKEAYGKVSQEVYNEIPEREKNLRKPLPETLQMSWSILLDPYGMFSFTFFAQCIRCSFEYSKTVKEKVDSPRLPDIEKRTHSEKKTP